MRITRKIIAEFVGVFLIGGVAGGLVTWKFTDRDLSMFMTNTNNPDNLAMRINKKYADQYHLTPDELNRIQPDIKEMAQAIYQVRHQFGLDVITTLDKYHAQIAAKLDPDHRDAYEKAMADRHAKLSTLLQPDQSSPGTGSQ
jgi:uncharacterized membrane protein